MLYTYDDLVIVRRVVAARRLHASGSTNAPSQSGATGLNAHATSRTRPLTPHVEKKDSVEFAPRPGRTAKRVGFWARLKCW